MSVREANIHSSAFNFNEFLVGGVDPRTGLYTCSLNFGEMTSGVFNGPLLPLRLFYSPLSDADIGLGKGWSMAFSRYDMASGYLTLAGGDHYKARQTPTELIFEDFKLNTVKISRPDSRRFDVIHKSGLREELSLFDASDIAVPRRIIAANGTAITLVYSSVNGAPVLTTVSDAKRTLLSITRTAGQISITQYPGTDSSAKYVLLMANDRVSSIGLPEGGRWKLTYESIGGLNCLTQLDSPMGARELIGYQADGHRLPRAAPIRSIPYVISHTLFPKQGQPAVEISYAFSQKNFLGFDDDDVSWSPDGDTLYQTSSNYTYSSTETLMAQAKSHQTIVRTYNKFHLLVSQVTTCNRMKTSKTIEYHLDPRQSFDQLPAQFRMPKIQTMRYENGKTKTAWEQVTYTEFDASGNLLKHIAPDGISTLSEFYPTGGEEGCPADPLGFVRFEKKRKIIPGTATAVTSDNTDAASSVVVRYRYALQPPLQDAVSPTVAPIEEELFELVADTETSRSKTLFDYYNTPTDALRHGLLQKQTITRDKLSTVSEFAYQLNGSELKLQTTVRGHDGTSSSSATTLSALNGLKLSEQSEDKGTVVFEYDVIGRQVSQTVAFGTANAATSSTVYQAANEKTPATILSTDVMGVQQKVQYDGLGRVIAIERQDCDNLDVSARTKMLAAYKARYDGLGRLVEETRIDRWDGVERPVATGFIHDDWGQVKTTAHADGRKEHREFEPSTQIETSWLEGMSKSIINHNRFGKPDVVETFNLKGESLGKILHQYDGLGRAISQTDPAGNKTTYKYDVFNRLCRSVLPDGHAVETTYAEHTGEPLAAQVKVADKILGKQKFDGLGRLIESTVGGRTVNAGYDAGLTQPAWQKSASGEKIEFKYDHTFGGRLTQRKATNLIATFTYDALHGQPTSCVEQGHETRFEYFPSGRLKSETIVHEPLNKKATYTYSFDGLPLTRIDVLGNEHKTHYDKWGRPVSYEQGSFKADFTYSTSGLVEQIKSRDGQGRLLLTTHLTYDDLGRETLRRFEIEGAASQTLACTYTLTGKLNSKILSRGDEIIRGEHFRYDQRGRLNLYTCDGAQRPLDPFGKEIVKQTYVFDALDNIVTLKTEFPEGSNTTTFTYSEIDPAQLSEVRHSHADYPLPIKLSFDANGQMTRDDQGRTLDYDALGRLVNITDGSGVVIRGYHYDALDRMVGLSQPAAPLSRQFYHDQRVTNEMCGENTRTRWHQSWIVLGDHQSHTGAKLFATDQQQSALTVLSDIQRDELAYSPYGHRSAESTVFSQPGFNGEQLDPVTGLYLLGNGYRAYSPTLMRFLGPDGLSPFGAGGLNAYVYCLGDPINRVDPTGHVSWQSVLGIGFSIFSIATSILTFGATTPLAIASLSLAMASALTGIASAVAHEIDPRSPAGDVLGYVSLGLGLASFAAGVGATARSASQVAGAYRSGLSGNSKEAAKAMASGMGRQGSQAGSTSSRWTFKTMNFRGRVDGVKTGTGAIPGFDTLDDAARAKFFQFKDAIKDGGMSPSEAASALGKHTYYNEMTPFRSAAPSQLTDPGFFNKTGFTEIRLNGAKRLFFYANRDTRTVTAFSIGHTLRGS